MFHEKTQSRLLAVLAAYGCTHLMMHPDGSVYACNDVGKFLIPDHERPDVRLYASPTESALEQANLAVEAAKISSTVKDEAPATLGDKVKATLGIKK